MLTCLDGKPVRDAKHRLLVNVTVKDIARAKKKKPDRCAVAIACRRQEKVDAKVFITRAYLHNGNGEWSRYMLPRSLQAELIAFDKGGSFEPGEYELRPPSKTERLGHRRGPDGRHTHKRKKVHHKTIGVRLSPRLTTS